MNIEEAIEEFGNLEYKIGDKIKLEAPFYFGKEQYVEELEIKKELTFKDMTIPYSKYQDLEPSALIPLVSKIVDEPPSLIERVKPVDAQTLVVMAMYFLAGGQGALKKQ